MIEKLNKMLEMQKTLDKSIMKEKGIKEVPIENIKLALFDELGELNHELKADWCWWKNHVVKDNKKVLEELVDCYHFGLMVYYNIIDSSFDGVEYEITYWTHTGEGDDLGTIYTCILDCDRNIIQALIWLTYFLGFTIDDVYEEYLRKNKVNYERLENNY